MYIIKILLTASLFLVELSVANPVKTVNGSVEIKYTEGLLQCVVKNRNDGSYLITWYRDDKIVSQNEDLKIDSEKHQLQLKDVSKNFGNYKCKLADQTGSLFSKTIQIKPESYITIESVDEKLENISIEMNSTETKTFRARCLIYSNPRANVTFLHNGNAVNKNERINIRKTMQGEGEIYELAINNISTNDIGEYNCRATNGLLSKRILAGIIFLAGQCSTDHHWTCVHDSRKCIPKTECKSYADCLAYNCERPSKPVVKVKDIGHDTISLTWEKDQKALKYTIIADTVNAYSRSYHTKEDHIELKGLKNATAYTITVYGANNAGMSKDEHVFLKTKRMVRPQIIQNIQVVRKDDVSIQIKWETPNDDGMENKHGDLLYRTSHCLYNNITKSSCIHKITNITSLDIGNINSNSLYMISVTTINKADQSGPSKNVYYRTASGKTSSARLNNQTSLMFILLLQIFLIVK